MKNSAQKIFRVLDVNFNRTSEALRVCEDVARFIIDDARIAASYKALRHKIAKNILALPVHYRAIVLARDSETDCGRNSFLIDKEKESVVDVFVKNIKRAGEAIRVIEEFTKLIDKKGAFQFQKIRFAVYVLEKKTIKKL